MCLDTLKSTLPSVSEMLLGTKDLEGSKRGNGRCAVSEGTNRISCFEIVTYSLVVLSLSSLLEVLVQLQLSLPRRENTKFNKKSP